MRAEILTTFDWLRHGFGTRQAPAWTRRLKTATLRQIHSGLVLNAEECGSLGDGDALVTNQPGLWLAVRTADCVPVLLADPVRRVVAAIHAGWRGTAARIVCNAVRRMESDFGCSASDVHAVIGPAIGSCCYEVGPEVAFHFRQYIADDVRFTGPMRVDLAEINRRQLGEVGVLRIGLLRLCTQCNAGLLHSFRRDKEFAGRMESAIVINHPAEKDSPWGRIV